MTRSFRRLLAMVLLVAVAGCATTQTIATREQFAALPTDQPIRVFAQHDRVYLLRQFALADTLVQGSGTLTEQARTSPFEGSIPFSQVVAITSTSPDVMKSLVFVGLTALFVGAIVDASGPGGLFPKVGTSYHMPDFSVGPGQSCPYVYVWDGAQYTLQAEPFGVAWGRALELTTSHLLPAARAEHGVVKLRLANERRESHFVNSVRAFAIDLGSAPAAVLDVEGTAWPLYRLVPPVVACDRAGRDILSAVTVADGRDWECVSSSTRAGSGYEDVLELTFTRTSQATEGSLVLTGINTALSGAVYEQLCTSVGDQTPALAHAIETDPELIAELRDYLRDASLSVAIWNGNAWVDAGAFSPEANAVAFTRALRIRVPEGAGGHVRVRLRSMADVWRIDALALDWSAVQALPATPLRLVSATGPSGEDARGEIGADDSRYTVLLPPDRLDLAFEAARVPAGRRVAYAVAARGYLMEWDPLASAARSNAPASWMPADRRIDMLKEILRHRELALAPAYEKWRRARTN